ncbi:MAG: SDR family oxidoreductase [Alphaproteobacteria bacterium]|nr:MAG: SDR family oxidoreductase [Alphaproteobacteria bacterium]
MKKSALITGAGRRIGRAIAIALASDGWNIALHYHNSRNDTEKLAIQIRKMGVACTPVRADLANPEEVNSLIPATLEALGPLLCLVNNAAIFEQDSIEDASAESFSRHMSINLQAPMLLTQAFARQVPDDAQGNIVNIADQRVFSLRPDFMTYTLSKSALWTLTQTTAMALAPKIRVNAIGPGPTLANTRQTAAQFKQQQQSVPLGYGPSAEEIAGAVRFLNQASSVTGEFISLDGGQHLPIYGYREQEGIE